MRLAAAFSVAALALFAAARCHVTSTRDALAFESEHVRERTTPSSARISSLNEVVYEPFQVSQEWQLGPLASWDRFVAEATASLGATYRCGAAFTSLTCVKVIAGDRFALHFARTDQAGLVRARLVARPE
jgi:hypothetical protein